MSSIDQQIHATTVLNAGETRVTDTQYGQMPVGSTLSIQCPLMPPDFKVYFNVPDDNDTDQSYQLVHPQFPIVDNFEVLDSYVEKIQNEYLLKILDELKISFSDVHRIEQDIRDQSSSSLWHHLRIRRFTASLCNKINQKKTARGLKTLAKNIILGNKNQKSNSVIQSKLSYGRLNEPIAIQKYENFMKLSGLKIMVESCGLVIDHKNYVRAATPDGKVIDLNAENIYGILEVKCSEEYRDVDPKDVCFVAKEPCILYDSNTGKICLNEKHSYYDQIQMQLALTTNHNLFVKTSWNVKRNIATLVLSFSY